MRACTGLAVAALLGVLSLACGGGDGGGGTTGPEAIPQVAGQWAGSRTTAPNACPDGLEAGTHQAVFGISQQGGSLVVNFDRFQGSGRVTSAGSVSANGREDFASGHFAEFSFSGQVQGNRLTGSGSVTETACGLDCPPTPCTTTHTFDLTKTG